ncbi:hypothetical protein QJQ45_005042 [Haematococcus lacustris]|nr:hypothetical protein QJQ45_005042 [Haematococcus lacustris]
MCKRSSLKRSYRRSFKRMHGLKRKRRRCDLIQLQAHVAGAGGSPILAANGSPLLAASGIPLLAIPLTPRTPLAPGSLQPTTSKAILTPSAGKENHGVFVKKDLLQLVELVTDAVSQHDELEEKSPCWKRIGAA